MCNGVLEKQGFEKPVAKVLTSVTDDGPGRTESIEDVGLDEFYHNRSEEHTSELQSLV